MIRDLLIIIALSAAVFGGLDLIPGLDGMLTYAPLCAAVVFFAVRSKRRTAGTDRIG